MINENYQAVVDSVKQLQNEFLEAQFPDHPDGNDGDAGAAAAEAGPPPEVSAFDACAPGAVADTQMHIPHGNDCEAAAAAAEAGSPPEVEVEAVADIHMDTEDGNDAEAGAAAAEAGPTPEGSAAEASAPVAGADMQKEGEEGLWV